LQNCPAGQSAVVAMFPVDVVVPHVLPGSHGMQSLPDTDLVFGEYVPAGHLVPVAVVVPAGQ
jgi:hypothetical protein